MPRRYHAYHQLVLVATTALAACTGALPVTPSDTEAALLAVQATPGTYQILFLKETSTGLAATSGVEPVGTYLVLKSEVRDAAGNLAQIGSVTYEYCWLKGDFAPRAACESGGGSWRRHMTMQIDPVGQLSGFGSCSTPRSIGFRVTYSGRKSGIANGVSPSRDFTWTAGS